MNRIDAIIFDLDGTLIDSEGNYYEADRLLMAEYDISFAPEMKRRFVGVGNQQMLAVLRAEYQLPDSVEVLLEKKNRLYLELARKDTRLFPEMGRLLALLRERGIKIAVASGSSREIINELLQQVGVLGYFTVILSSEEVLHPKPDPDVFLEAARRLNTSPRHTAVIEDSAFGVDAAVRAEMRCIAIPTFPTPLDPVFRKAALLFGDGMDSFRAEKVIEWLEKGCN